MHWKAKSLWINWLLSVVILFSATVQNSGASSERSNVCSSKETCSECITEDPSCAWCTQDDFVSEGDAQRCDKIENLRNTCKEVVVPKTEVFITKNKKLSDLGERKQEVIQMKPQRIKLVIRPKSPMRFQLQFRQAMDYPVDLYYLMDLSNSMKDDKDNLAELGNKLATVMKNITSNFQLGFGSFVDKVATPYVMITKSRLNEPCPDCAAPYGFWNNMPLNSNTAIFAKKVNESKISGNLDAPEGGLDAIMQAVVCKEKIGWREKARKLLLFSTDNAFHYAGDGKLAGIIPPNDGACHLNDLGRYTMSEQQDYPSLSQLNHKVKENKVNVIFAITSEFESLYARLSKRLVGSYAGKLQEDSSNVVELIRQQYDKITSSVEMTHSIKDTESIKVTFYSKCFGSELMETNVCNGLKVGATVTFDVDVEVSACPKDPELWNQTFEIYPVGLNDHLTVHLQMICDCDCEKPWNEEKNSPRCNSGNGTYECGICSCYGSLYGKKCECDELGGDSSSVNLGCSRGNDTVPCSGRGSCMCGKCFCNKRPNPEEIIYGTFCQCDNFSCDRKDDKVCSDHGICDCGKCKCHHGWNGKDCSCDVTRSNCMGDNEKICSGHGECRCGECFCNSTEQEYYGKFCDDCTTCEGKCEQYRPCVECHMSQKDSSEKNCSDLCGVEIRFLDKITESENVKEKICSFKEEDECKFYFKYIVDGQKENMPFVFVQKEKECPTPVNMMAVVFGVTGSVVGVGLFLLLLLKLLTTIHDRRELAKFEKERQRAKWEKAENPIYVQATSTFQNPAYRGE